MKKQNDSHGFSMVELIIVAAAMGGIALVVMQLNKSSISTQGQAQIAADYSSFQRDVSFLLQSSGSCTASLKDVVRFNGATIRSTPVTGLEFWSADQNGVRSTRKFYPNVKYGKLTVEDISFSMPDYSGANYPEGVNQRFRGEFKFTGVGSDSGKSKVFRDLILPVNVSFDTDNNGLSTIKSCSLGFGLTAPIMVSGEVCDASTGNIAVDETGGLLTCQAGVWKFAGGGGLGDGQTWTDVTASRALDVEYENTTGKPIMVRVSGRATNGTFAIYFYVNGTFAGVGRAAYTPSGGVYYSGTEFLVPKDAKYRLSCGQCFGHAMTGWHELR